MTIEKSSKKRESSEVAVIIETPQTAPAVARGPTALYDLSPQAMVHQASEIATALAGVIEKQKLFTSIQGRKHVRVEGWTTLGMMLGILPREVEVKEIDGGDYEATVELYNVKSGQVVGRASALCGKDERRWASADRYARRSMATTRATGKAYRLGFAWILALAGYEATPAEEIPEPVPRQAPGFDPENTKHAHALKVELEKRGVPEDYWEAIGRGMTGKTNADIQSVIQNVVS